MHNIVKCNTVNQPKTTKTLDNEMYVHVHTNSSQSFSIIIIISIVMMAVHLGLISLFESLVICQ